MKRNKLSLMVALTSFSMFTFGLSAHGASARRMSPAEIAATTRAATEAATAARSSTTGTGSTTAGATYIVPESGGNAADSGRDSSTQQLVGAAVNVGAAAMYMSICPTWHGSWACPMAAMAGVAAGMLGRASGGSAGAGAAMSAYDPASFQYGVNGGVDANGNPIDGSGGAGSQGTGGARLPDGTTPQTISSAVAGIKDQLSKSGVSISADGRTMTTKDGRKFDLSKGGDGSAGGLQALGMTAAEANQAIEAGKKYGAAANAKYASMIGKLGAEGGGGGGGGRGIASEGSGGGGMGGMGGWGKDPFGKNRPKPKISGLTRKLGDDTIGVAGDDIFEMVTRRYKARDQVNQFLKD